MIIKQVKSNLFRVIPVDDLSIEYAIHDRVQFTLWNDRVDFPESIDYSSEEAEGLPAVKFIRDVEAVFSLDLETAKRLSELLASFLAELEDSEV